MRRRFVNGTQEFSSACSVGVLAALFGVAIAVDAHAQQAEGGVPAPQHGATKPRSAFELNAGGFEKIQLTAGRSTVLTTDFDITRIAVTNPAVADAPWSRHAKS